MIKKFFILTLMVSVSFFCNSQSSSKVFDFNSCSNSTNCNPFYVNNGLCGSDKLVIPLFGAPKYFSYSITNPPGNKKAVLFRSKWHSPFTTYGDGFSLEKVFKRNKFYRIDVVASGIPGVLPPGNIARLSLALDKTYGGFYTNCDAGTVTTPFNSQIVGTVQPIAFNQYFSDPVYTTTYNYVKANDDYFYLGVRSNPWSITTDTTKALLQKVTIKEYEFQLSPATLQVSCNSAQQQTFTVSNPDNIPTNNISYTWDLGPMPNGWIYNGAPAPRYPPVNGNSITLEYSCGSTLANDVFVTVNNNGAIYEIYKSDIQFSSSAPILTITGKELFCTSSSTTGYQYSVANLPCNSLVSWSLGTTGFTLTPIGNDVIVYANAPVNNSTATLYATITNGCNQVSGAQKSLFFSTSQCACTVPANLSAIIPPSSSTPVLSWDNITGIQYYEVNYQYFDCIWGVTSEGTTGSMTNSMLFYNPGPGTRVRFRVRALCQMGFFNDYSNWYEFVVPSTCSIPAGLLATPSSGTNVTLSWGSVPGATSYDVYWKYNAGSGFINSSPVTVMTNSYNFSQAPLGSIVEYAVKAKCSGIYSPMSNCFQFNMPCPTPIGGITCMSAYPGIYVYFPTIPFGVTAINLKYRVYGNPTEYTINNIPATSPYHFLSGTPGTLYQFAIQFVCAGGTTGSYGPWSITPGQYRLSQLPVDTNPEFSSIFPNPASNEVTVLLDPVANGVSEITVFNQSGAMVLKRTVNRMKIINATTLDISSLPNGIYFIRIIGQNKLQTHKLVINRL